ncbi:hypothetical protein CIB93_09110 [Streptomyces sp. WZ.A104]|uniref:hypothetical protein n=1 Tax=Streptomyces sp. WZ.A104 TaxID=2023771 RepID=UPI000BBB80E8|nr:hypothetical protein [Streptomyces sp. WZ.A104]PCG86380.1 hypothetical protein CIB93_09110 [Streptomyces sp. WZ.A104]
MNKIVKFPVEIVTHGEIEIDIDVPDEFLDEDGDVCDEDGLRDWLNDNENEWYELVPPFEEIQSKEVIEIANVY